MGERNFGFDSLKSRLNRTMEEKGFVGRDRLPLPAAQAPPPRAHDMEEAAEAPPRADCGQRGSSGRQSRATIPFSSVQSVLPIDVEVE